MVHHFQLVPNFAPPSNSSSCTHLTVEDHKMQYQKPVIIVIRVLWIIRSSSAIKLVSFTTRRRGKLWRENIRLQWSFNCSVMTITWMTKWMCKPHLINLHAEHKLCTLKRKKCRETWSSFRQSVIPINSLSTVSMQSAIGGDRHQLKSSFLLFIVSHHFLGLVTTGLVLYSSKFQMQLQSDHRPLKQLEGAE